MSQTGYQTNSSFPKPTIESSSSTKIVANFPVGTVLVGLHWAGFGDTYGNFLRGELVSGKGGKKVWSKLKKCPRIGCSGCSDGWKSTRAHKPLAQGHVMPDQTASTQAGKITWEWPDTTGGLGRRYKVNGFGNYGWVNTCLKDKGTVASPGFKNGNEIPGDGANYRQMYADALPAGHYEIVAFNKDYKEFSISDSFEITSSERFTQENFSNPCGGSANCGTVDYPTAVTGTPVTCSDAQTEPKSELSNYDAPICAYWYGTATGGPIGYPKGGSASKLSDARQKCFTIDNQCSCNASPGCSWKRSGNNISNSGGYNTRNVRCSQHGCVSEGDNYYVNTGGWKSNYSDDGKWI